MYNIYMPVVLRFRNLVFRIYFNDHGRPHVHISSGDCEAKIELETLKIVQSSKFSQRDLRRALVIIDENFDFFMECWNEYNEEN